MAGPIGTRHAGMLVDPAMVGGRREDLNNGQGNDQAEQTNGFVAVSMARGGFP